MSEIPTAWVEGQGGTRLAVREAGSGPGVLLIPGLGYAAWSFARQMGVLSAEARVLALDNRGAGRSDKPDGPYSIDQMAEDAYAVLVQRQAGPATVVGTSLGGYVAMTLALRHPEAVRSLVLVATTCGGPGARAVPEETLRSWAEAARLGEEGFARATMPLSFAPGWCGDHPSEFEEILSMRLASPTPVAAWRAQFEAGAEFLRVGLADGVIQQPTLIVHGTADRVVPYENAALLARRLPHAKVVTMQDAGHLCWIERSKDFNEMLLEQVRAPQVS